MLQAGCRLFSDLTKEFDSQVGGFSEKMLFVLREQLEILGA